MTVETAAEQEVLKKIQAEQEAGGDPFGDDEFDDQDVGNEAPEKMDAQLDESATDANGREDEAGDSGEQATPAPKDQDAGEKAGDDSGGSPVDEPGDGGSADSDPADDADNADDPGGKADADAVNEREGAATADSEEADAGDADEDRIRPTRYEAQVPKDYADKRAELIKSKSALMKKLMDGDIDVDEYSAQELKISSDLEDLTAQRIRAETLLEANQQSQQQERSRAIQALIRRSKGTIDYLADPKAQKQFDAAMSVIASDDDAGDNYADLVEQAHRMVLAARGITQPQVMSQPMSQATQQPAQQSTTQPASQTSSPLKAEPAEPAPEHPKAQPPSRKPEGEVPVTLRGIPAASTPNANGDIMDQLGRLSGQDFEDAFSKLSPAQRARLLDEE